METKLFLRLFLIALVLCLALPLLAACTQTPDDPGSTDDPGTNTPGTNDPGTQTPEIPDRYDVEDTLPAQGELDYGTQFNILYLNDNLLNNFWVDEPTGGAVDNAVFAAIAKTEERFGVTIVATKSSAADEYAHRDNIRNQIGGGKTDFDMARVHDVQGVNLSLEGLFLNLYDVEPLNFDKPWWPAKTVSSLTFMDQLYMISSSMSYNGLSSARAMFFNKSLMEDYGIELPYQAVLDETWTMDYMLSLVEDIHEEGGEVDGKSLEDTFGILFDETFYKWFESFGIEMVTKGEDGDSLILNGSDERIYNLIDALYRVGYEQNGGYILPRSNANEMFGNGRAIFFSDDVGSAVTVYSQYDLDYGILPMPLLDETQEGYYAGYTDRFFIIPNTCKDTEYVGHILESMSAEGYRTVTSVYFETVLKDRYSKDPESKAMVDLIQENMILDFSYAYGNDKWWSRALYELLKAPEQSRNYASYYEKMLPDAESRCGMIIDKFTAMLGN